MPTIKLTDQVSAQIDLAVNPDSALGKYLKDPAEIKCINLDFNQLHVPLDQLPLKSLDSGIEFSQKVGLGVSNTELTFQAGLTGGIKLLSSSNNQLFDPDLYGDQIKINPGELYLAVTTNAKLSPEFELKAGDLTFGFSSSSDLTLTSYNFFKSDHGVGFPDGLEALNQAISQFTIPGDLEDLAAMKPGSISTVDGSGSLKVSGEFNILSVTNPLAVATLPDPIGQVKLSSGGAIKIGASFELIGNYQLRLHKTDENKLRLGYYRKRGTEFGVKVSASVGLSGGVKKFDAIEELLKAISSNPTLDVQALKAGGLSEGQVESIKKVLEAGISRKLELASSFELNSSQSQESAFLFEIDLAAISEAGRRAVHKALDGDLSDLVNPPSGITTLKTIFTETQKTKHALKINLLGIYNFFSVSTLVLKGTVMFEPITGQLTITDKTTATRIAASTLNFAADADKLRKVMSESVLISAAYRCSKLLIQPPTLAITHSYVEIHSKTDSTEMKNNLDVLVSLDLLKPQERTAILASTSKFGRSIFYAETTYDEAAAESLFFTNNTQRTRKEFEDAGRRALGLLVQPGDPDDFRRLIATDSALWDEVKRIANPNELRVIDKLRNLSDRDRRLVSSDALGIIWWAKAMATMTENLAKIRSYLANNPTADPENNSFKALRRELSSSMKKVAAETDEQFGDPWGLVSMDQVSGQQAGAHCLITTKAISLSKVR